jgi:hypothetical protein
MRCDDKICLVCAHSLVKPFVFSENTVAEGMIQNGTCNSFRSNLNTRFYSSSIFLWRSLDF